MIVVDTNVIAYLYLPGEYTTAAEAMLQADPVWAAPVLWRSEFRSILGGYVRRGTLTLDQAIAMQAEAEALMSAHEYAVDSRTVLAAVASSDCSAYDCEFAVLAQHLGVRLVTMDGKLLKAFPAIALSLASAVSADHGTQA